MIGSRERTQMSRRPTITDLAAAAGVSVATVDPVLNQRHPVREGTAERVLRAPRRSATTPPRCCSSGCGGELPVRTFGFLLRKQEVALLPAARRRTLQAATAACTAVRGRAVVEFMEELSPATIVETLRRVGAQVDALAVVSVDHPHVSEAIADLRRDGVPVFAIVTDPDGRGRGPAISAATTGRRAAPPPGWWPKTARGAGQGQHHRLGSHRYLCRETAEISFRSYFREHAPRVPAAGAADQPRGCADRARGDARSDGREPRPGRPLHLRRRHRGRDRARRGEEQRMRRWRSCATSSRPRPAPP